MVTFVFAFASAQLLCQTCMQSTKNEDAYVYMYIYFIFRLKCAEANGPCVCFSLENVTCVFLTVGKA